MPPCPRRRSSARPARGMVLAAAVVAGVGCLVVGGVLLYEREAARADAARLREIEAEMDDVLQKRRWVEIGIPVPAPLLTNQPEHTRLPHYTKDGGWQAVMLRLSNLDRERREILDRRPHLRP